MKKIGFYLALLLVLTTFDHSREITVTGRVTSAADGAPLPGVNVLLKGTTNGTVTNHNGEYFLKIPSAGGTLVFSFIGLPGASFLSRTSSPFCSLLQRIDQSFCRRPIAASSVSSRLQKQNRSTWWFTSCW